MIARKNETKLINYIRFPAVNIDIILKQEENKNAHIPTYLLYTAIKTLSLAWKNYGSMFICLPIREIIFISS